MPDRPEDKSPAPDPTAEFVTDVFVERQERRVSLFLSQAPILDVAARGKQHLRWRATNAQITWSRERIDRNGWQDWTASLTVYGPHVRTDGTEGKSTHVVDGRRALTDRRWAWVLETTRPDHDEAAHDEADEAEATTTEGGHVT